MKSDWELTRTTIIRDDGQRRWDYVYQFLLQWAMENPAGLEPAPSHTQEDHHENRSLCSCLNHSTAANANH